jgi:hypothetical protein
VIARLWQVELISPRAYLYDRFVQQRSAVMFRQLPGCLGALFFRSANTAAALSFWASPEDIKAGTQSEIYRSTVRELLAAELVREDTQVVSLFDHGVGGTFLPELLAAGGIETYALGSGPGCLPGI